MPEIETQPRVQRTPTSPRSLRALAVPAGALLGAVLWYVAVRSAEAELFVQEETRSLDLARDLMNKRRELERKRLENEVAILAYDPRLGTMLKTNPEPLLIEEFAKSVAKLLPGQGVAILSTDGALIGTSIRDLDPATLRSSSVIDRARSVKPHDAEDVANLARSGFWVMRGEDRRILKVAASRIHLGEPIGMIALTTSFNEVLRDVQQLSGVSGAIFVGSEIFSVEPPEMRDTFASLADVVPGPLARVTRGPRELIVRADEIESGGLGVRVVWVDDAAPRGGWFGLLLWIPIAGAVFLGVREGLAQDRLQKKRGG
jgi:hypothetical protein